MKHRGKIIVTLAVLMLMVVTSTVSAQYVGYSWYTAYQVVNMGTQPADIIIDYYDANGVRQAAAQKQYLDVLPGSSRLVVQFIDDPNLGSGQFSAVISADQPIAAIANQQLVKSGSQGYSPVPPFSTYSGQSTGANQVTLPAVMYNWYGYYTDVFIMNVGGGKANDVDISYIPGDISGQATGASGVSDNNNTINQYASITKSQQNKTDLAAPSGPYQGRFLGSAKLVSDQPIIAVVNQHNTANYKLMTYNGFTAGATNTAMPTHMRNYFGYYTTLLIGNPSAVDTAQVTITYTPSGPYNAVSSGIIEPVTVQYNIAPGKALTRYEGPGSIDDQSDLDDGPIYTRFYGSVKVTSNKPVVVQTNIEALSSGDDQAGSFNGIDVSQATKKIVVPVILADYYGYYTTLVVQNVTGTDTTCTVTYTSDSTYSAVKNASKSYNHDLPANGSFTVYEGRKGGQENGDINHDPFWRAGSAKQFIGAAEINCGQNAVAFVNEEADITKRDSMYTFNTFNK
jgi:hypothetical protein